MTEGNRPECDIVIAVWNLRDITMRCIESIIKNTDYPYHIIIVDNGSDYETKTYLEQLRDDSRIKKYTLIRNEENSGATKAFNQGMLAAKAPLILLLNNDTIVTKGWLTEMVRAINSAPDVGIVNPNSNNMGTRVPKNKTLDEFAKELSRRFSGKFIEQGLAVGFCYLMKRKMLDEIGIWNESYGFGNYEETEHCILARRAGYRFLMAKGTYVFHEEHATFKTLTVDPGLLERQFEDNKKKFENKYGITKRILYIATNPNEELIEKVKKGSHAAASNGMWVHIIAKRGLSSYNFKDRKHGWVKVFFYIPIFFRLRCLIRVLIKKKAYHEIYVDDIKLYRLLEKFTRMRKSMIFLVQ